MRLLRLLAPIACVLAVSAVHPPAHVDASAAKADGIFCRIYLDPHDQFTRVMPPPKPRTFAALRSTASVSANAVLSNITVNYTGFTPQAQAAFQAAVDLWQQEVSTTVPIVVDATFRDLGNPFLLGQASSGAVSGFPNQPRPSTFFVFPLANSFAGFDYGTQFNPTASHINADFNSTAAWSFATDGSAQGGKVDFESVVMHELGHGLGFMGTGFVSGGVGSVGAGQSNLPYIYDVSVVDGAGTSILNASVYPNNSTALGQLLQSNNLFWGGAQGTGANGGVRPTLYAPAIFEPGSSYSHLDDNTYPAGNINSLMTHQIGSAEVIHTPGPIVLGTFRDMGWTTATSSCTFQLTPRAVTVGSGGGPGSVNVVTQAGCASNPSSGNTAIATITNTSSATGNATVSYNVLPNNNLSQRVVTLTIGDLPFVITQNGTGPTVALDRTTLFFNAATNGAGFTSQTGTQAVRLTQGAGSPVSWTATSNMPWLLLSTGGGAASTSASGAGPALINVSVQFVAGLSPSQSGTITFNFTNAGNSAGPISVTLNTIQSGTSAPPFGLFETPASGTTGVAGSIAVTGWALDDLQVSRVTICRDVVGSETVAFDANCNAAKIYIGDAIFVDGARPDVQAANPGVPFNTRAGWGYLMLTNFLPNGGNGPFTLYASAFDADGHATTLGSKAIDVDNLHSTSPFGTIDRPMQGEVVSGTLFNNFGWVLSPGTARADVPGGGTTRVFIDGIDRGTPGGWGARPDLQALFPKAQYSGVDNANAVFPFDTTTLANGSHTIHWITTATAGSPPTAGIGSRFFTVSNGGGVFLDPSTAVTSNVILSSAMLQMPRAAALRMSSPQTLTDEIDAAAIDLSSIQGRRGFDLESPLARYTPALGRITVQSEELDRIELHLSPGGRHQYTGYLRTAAGVTPLPIGSSLDAPSGWFAWMPGVGFVGSYDLVFVRWSGGRAVARQDVRIVLNPKGSNRVGPQLTIDTPGASASGGPTRVRHAFMLAGWAADLDSTVDNGVDTVHVWAYPVNEAGQREDPIFLGPASFGNARPDVAAVYGDRFERSGYGMIVQTLAPGTYDLAVFAYSTVRHDFAPAKVVRVTVK